MKAVIVVLLLAGVVFCGCAKIQSPPGGPEDKTPPEVINTIPESGAVNVDRKAPVVIEFSEPVVKDKIGEAIYVSPRPPVAPQFGGARNTIEIEWRDSLAAKVTYLVTVAARVADRHRNRLAEPFVLAFSTGPVIDSGVITGIVFDRKRPAANAQVLLFTLPLDSADAIFTSPDYITECGPDGTYRFSYLPDASYRAIAAIDKNKNRQLDLGEKAGVGAFDAVLAQEQYLSPPLYLYLRDIDTARFELVRCRVNPDRVVLAEFSHTVDSLSLHFAEWSVEPVGEGDKPQIVSFDVDRVDEKTIRLLLDGAQTGVSYRLAATGLADESGRKVDSVLCTCEFFWPVTADTILPEIILSSPDHRAGRVDLQHEIGVWFSEPVDTARVRTNFLLADSSGQRVSGSIEWLQSWKMTFTPEFDLAGGMEYTMALDSGSVIDRAGNATEGRWAASFTTIEPSEFGGIAGSLSVSREEWLDRAIILEFLPIKKKHSPVRKTQIGSASFEYELPAGMYTLRIFVDLNENRRLDRGSIQPFTPAEPQFFFPDTIEVRARFITEAVSLDIP